MLHPVSPFLGDHYRGVVSAVAENRYYCDVIGCCNVANRCLGTSRLSQRTKSIHMRLISPFDGILPADASSIVTTGIAKSIPA